MNAMLFFDLIHVVFAIYINWNESEKLTKPEKLLAQLLICHQPPPPPPSSTTSSSAASTAAASDQQMILGGNRLLPPDPDNQQLLPPDPLSLGGRGEHLMHPQLIAVGQFPPTNLSSGIRNSAHSLLISGSQMHTMKITIPFISDTAHNQILL